MWKEKKKKDELLMDTDEYRLVQQRMDAYCNDASMVVVSMDSDYILSKNKKTYPPLNLPPPSLPLILPHILNMTPNRTTSVTTVQTTSTVTRNPSIPDSSYDEWTGLVSVIGTKKISYF